MYTIDYFLEVLYRKLLHYSVVVLFTMHSTTLTNDEDGCFDIMFTDVVIIRVHWFANIYKHDYGHRIKYPHVNPKLMRSVLKKMW
jgi:hypothetical protein